MRRRRPVALLLAALVAGVAVGCDSGGAGSSTAPGTTTTLPEVTVGPVSTAPREVTAAGPPAPVTATTTDATVTEDLRTTTVPTQTAPTTTTTTAPATTPDAAAIRGVITAYTAAFAARDGRAACGLLTSGAQQDLVDAVSPSAQVDTCPEAFTRVAGQFTDRELLPFESADISNIIVQGNTATATLVVNTSPSTVRLLREGGDWLIDGQVSTTG